MSKNKFLISIILCVSFFVFSTPNKVIAQTRITRPDINQYKNPPPPPPSAPPRVNVPTPHITAKPPAYTPPKKYDFKDYYQPYNYQAQGINNDAFLPVCINDFSLFDNDNKIANFSQLAEDLNSQVARDSKNNKPDNKKFEKSVSAFYEIENLYEKYIAQLETTKFVTLTLLREKDSMTQGFQNCAKKINILNYTTIKIESAIDSKILEGQNFIYESLIPIKDGILKRQDIIAASEYLNKSKQIPKLFENIKNNHTDLQIIIDRLVMANSQIEGSYTKKRRENKDYSPIECFIENGDVFKYQNFDMGDIYPTEAENKGINGRVTVRINIDETGNVESSEFIQASDPIFLDTKILNVLSNLKFYPKISNCITESGHYTFSMNFMVN